MARGIQDKPNVSAPTTEYPSGDITDFAAGVDPGTPVDREVYADFHQFYDRVFSLIGKTFNGLADNAINGFELVDGVAEFLIRKVNTSFTLQTSSSLDSWTDVVHGGGQFVAVNGSCTKVMRSIDGVSWVESAIVTPVGFALMLSLSYGNGAFVLSFVTLTPGVNDVYRSTDGINWTIQATGASGSLTKLRFLNGGFISSTIVANGFVSKSADGITWSEFPLPDTRSYRLSYGNGVYVGVTGTGASPQVITSLDGETWAFVASTPVQPWLSIEFGNNTFVVTSFQLGAANDVMTSSDGVNWTLRSSGVVENVIDLKYGTGLFIAIRGGAGTAPVLMSSPNGYVWTEVPAPDTNPWTGFTFGGNKFVAVRLGSSVADSVMIAL